MGNELMMFEGIELEILTKEDVNFKFNGEVLFNGKQIARLLGYSNCNRDIDRHCDEECIELITEEKLSTKLVLSLGQRGTKFINEDGVMDLIYNSKLPKAKEFKKKVREIVREIQQTGKYDSVEQQIMKIEDSKEKELSLSLYGLEQTLKYNSNDMLTVLAYNNKKAELEMYKQQKQLEAMKTEVVEMKEVLESVKENTEIIKNQQAYICNRTNFYEKVRILANKYFGRDIQKAYSELYTKMKTLGSFDVYTRRKHAWEQINAEREKQGKKPYKSTTLKSKINMLDIIDDYNKWELCSEAYKTIEAENMK